MPRPRLHSDDAIMDAARAVVLTRGARGATIGAIANQSGAPTGSIYHRFASVEELLARTWMRAMRRVQEALLSSEEQDPIAATVAGALAVYDFCLRHREEALLASSFRRSDFVATDFSDEARSQLEGLNSRIDPFLATLARRLGGPGQQDVALLAVRDLPFGAALPHIRNATRPPPERRKRLEAAVRAVVHGRSA
jgi:AcrR family transcriptional regulator